MQRRGDEGVGEGGEGRRKFEEGAEERWTYDEGRKGRGTCDEGREVRGVFKEGPEGKGLVRGRGGSRSEGSRSERKGRVAGEMAMKGGVGG